MKYPYKLALVATIVLPIALVIYYLYQYAVDSPLRISSKDAKTHIQNNEVDLILDIRTDFERSTLGFYPGSVHIQSADLEQQMSTEFPDKNIRIVVYCNSGQRARAATEKLHKLGYNNARYIATTYRSLL